MVSSPNLRQSHEAAPRDSGHFPPCFAAAGRMYVGINIHKSVDFIMQWKQSVPDDDDWDYYWSALDNCLVTYSVAYLRGDKERQGCLLSIVVRTYNVMVTKGSCFPFLQDLISFKFLNKSQEKNKIDLIDHDNIVSHNHFFVATSG